MTPTPTPAELNRKLEAMAAQLLAPSREFKRPKFDKPEKQVPKACPRCNRSDCRCWG